MSVSFYVRDEDDFDDFKEGPNFHNAGARALLDAMGIVDMWDAKPMKISLFLQLILRAKNTVGSDERRVEALEKFLMDASEEGYEIVYWA